MYSFQSWDAYFRNNSYVAPPSLAPAPKGHVSMSEYRSVAPQMGGGLGSSMAVDERLIDDHLDVQAIIRSYQVKDGTGDWLTTTRTEIIYWVDLGMLWTILGALQFLRQGILCQFYFCSLVNVFAGDACIRMRTEFSISVLSKSHSLLASKVRIEAPNCGFYCVEIVWLLLKSSEWKRFGL